MAMEKWYPLKNFARTLDHRVCTRLSRYSVKLNRSCKRLMARSRYVEELLSWTVLLAVCGWLVGVEAQSILLQDPAISQENLGCHRREYTYLAKQPTYQMEDGELVECFGNVTVVSCWGMCDSSEVPDFEVPYRKSKHPVCSYATDLILRREYVLEYCHPLHPIGPLIHVFDATECECQNCNTMESICESLNG